ncbi:MAG: enoyl-CoA hydratase/isomerase family protein [Pseudomonadota bacterium]|uniref:enoyl-CoA hydratase/isomerase family protein n=1 Tax=Alcanivorax sp. NBRC 102024 TaxID=1113895 RepID=UPI0009EE9491|nr:enoyl-CoA hydratase/isomerase family protein [Alcanivorax sp. NBRC 102024]MEE2602851.1 enoyl-CoA hydratase/isomerase family protein [Pseudomonadota bacterium]
MSVTIQTEGSVARITLDNPEKRNAFDDRIIASLTEAFEQAGSDDGVRVVVLQAAGKHFSAGADLNWMRAMGKLDAQQNRDDALKLARLMQSIDQCPKPVIARVQGAAFGGALGLICAADMAVAADNARFCLSEVKLGIVPAVISPYVVRAMGARQANRYFMTAEVIPAERAVALGIAHEVVPESELNDSVDSLINALLAAGPQAQIEARNLIARVGHGPIDQTMLNDTADLIARLRTGEEGQEGLSAFLEKRTPNWI